MSRSLREVAEKVLALWSAGENLPGELLDPEVEWVNPTDSVESGTRHGTAGWEGAERNWTQSFSEVRFEIERAEERGDLVATAVRCFSTARGSGLEIERVLGFLWTIREGRVVRFEWSNDPEEVLRRLA